MTRRGWKTTGAERAEVRKDMERYGDSRACAARLRARAARLRERAQGTSSPAFDGMPKGGVPYTMGDAVADAMELEERAERMEAAARAVRDEVAAEVDTLRDARLLDVMECVYVERLTVEQAAEELGYSPRHVAALQAEALDELASNRRLARRGR